MYITTLPFIFPFIHSICTYNIVIANGNNGNGHGNGGTMSLDQLLSQSLTATEGLLYQVTVH
jgi:hypothetical protein